MSNWFGCDADGGFFGGSPLEQPPSVMASGSAVGGLESIEVRSAGDECLIWSDVGPSARAIGVN